MKRGIGIFFDWELMIFLVIFKCVFLFFDGGGLMEKEYKMVVEKFNKMFG